MKTHKRLHGAMRQDRQTVQEFPSAEFPPEHAFQGATVANIGVRRVSRHWTLLVALVGVGTLAVIAFGWFRPTAASAEPSGILAVESDPAGATVFIDGQARGTTPASLTLRAGTHHLLVRRGERTQELSVTITKNMSVVHHFTWPTDSATANGSLRVISDGSPGRVTVDGVDRGRTPLAVNDLTAGDHEVAVLRDGNVERRTIRVEPGATASLVVGTAAATGPESGWLVAKTQAPLQILEDDKLVGSTESERILMPVGAHTFQFASPTLGFSVSKSVSIAAGKTQTVAIDLPRAPISINATPWAQVWLDGQALGDTPIGNLTATIGSHEVIFRHPQLGERRVTALVTLKAPARVAVDMSAPQ
jgi:hypothetical protein